MSCILKKCHKYKICKKKKNPFEGNILCEGYDRYVKQDSIMKRGSQFEIPFSNIGFEIQLVDEKMKNEIFNSDKSLKELIIQMYFFDHMKAKAIRKQLECNISYIYEIIRECKNKLLEK